MLELFIVVCCTGLLNKHAESETDPVGAKTPIFNRYSLVTPQP